MNLLGPVKNPRFTMPKSSPPTWENPLFLDTAAAAELSREEPEGRE